MLAGQCDDGTLVALAMQHEPWIIHHGPKEGHMKGKEHAFPAHKSIAVRFLRDKPGTAAQRLALFEKLKAAGGLDGEDPEQVQMAENALQMLAAMEK
jgi:hypothetical protein